MLIINIYSYDFNTPRWPDAHPHLGFHLSVQLPEPWTGISSHNVSRAHGKHQGCCLCVGPISFETPVLFRLPLVGSRPSELQEPGHVEMHARDFESFQNLWASWEMQQVVEY